MQRFIALTFAFVMGGCNDGSNAVKDIPAGAPVASESVQTSSSALAECGLPADQSCTTVNLDMLKIKGKSEAKQFGETKVLDCTGGRMSRNTDGTWDLCKCACVPASKAGKT